MKWEGRPTPPGLRLIAAVKLLKALLLFAFAVETLRLLHRDMFDVPTEWIAELHLDPDSRIAGVIGRLSGLEGGTFEKLAAGSLFYASLLFTEGVGLALGKRWAEYLTVVATASFVPVEVYEIARRVTPIRLAVLFANVAILGYLIRRIRRERATTTTTGALMS